MTTQKLIQQLESRKEFYSILDVTIKENEMLSITVKTATLSSLANLYETLSLNKFETESVIRFTGYRNQTLEIVTRKL